MAPLGMLSWHEERTFFGSSEAASALASGAATEGTEEADAGTEAALESGAITTTVEDGEPTTTGSDEPEVDGDALDDEGLVGGCA